MKESVFSPQDQAAICAHGLSLAQAEQQLAYFRTGFPYLKIVAAAAPGAGICVLRAQEEAEAAARFSQWRKRPDSRSLHFVPASGAATRMFKSLYEALHALEQDPGARLAPEAEAFFARLEDFAFYPYLQALPGFDATDRLRTLQLLLGRPGLDYGKLPKGLLAFHRYAQAAVMDGKARTPFEEHLCEAAAYGLGAEGDLHLHFTVSPEHRPAFEALAARATAFYGAQQGARIRVDFSEQQPSTDTLAVNEDNSLFRQADGSLLFRPGGHGALLANLNALDTDLVFIKNIDNVAHGQRVAVTAHWKQVMAGTLLRLRERVFAALEALDRGCSPQELEDLVAFCKKELCMDLPSLAPEALPAFLHARLNRPLRVCGMVKNTGEPGGGPFVIAEADGTTSLQILESAQINHAHPESEAHFLGGGFFNPVDLVCWIRDYQGRPFDLAAFADPSTGFIAAKSAQGRALKAQELPGLWNGAMGRWLTVFVEVPLATFNPVKTVNDLLKAAHQG